MLPNGGFEFNEFAPWVVDSYSGSPNVSAPTTDDKNSGVYSMKSQSAAPTSTGSGIARFRSSLG